MGRPPELKDEFFRAEFLAGVYSGDATVPKFEKDRKSRRQFSDVLS
jgi:hypothetical protein